MKYKSSIFMLVVALLFGLVATNVLATSEKSKEKTWICHKNKKSLYLPIHEAKGHLKNHKEDYKGKCRVKPTPTPTECPQPTVTPTPTEKPEPTPTDKPEPTPTSAPNPPIVTDTSNLPQHCEGEPLTEAPVVTEALMYNSTGCLEIDISYAPEANGDYLYNIYVSPTGEDVRGYWNVADQALNPVEGSNMHFSFCELPQGQKDLIACVQNACGAETCSPLFIDDVL